MPKPTPEQRGGDGRILYGAYGSNLHLEQMHHRCPAAEALGEVYVVRGWRLAFRSVADIERARGQSVALGVWKITDACLAALDRYEGALPDDRGTYRRVWLKLPKRVVRKFGASVMLVYQMNAGRPIRPPSDGYLKIITMGYADWCIDTAPLKAAVKHCFM